MSIGLLSFQLQYSKLIRFNQKSNHTQRSFSYFVNTKNTTAIGPGLNFRKSSALRTGVIKKVYNKN